MVARRDIAILEKLYLSHIISDEDDLYMKITCMATAELPMVIYIDGRLAGGGGHNIALVAG
jgi:hypothetical protein